MSVVAHPDKPKPAYAPRYVGFLPMFGAGMPILSSAPFTAFFTSPRQYANGSSTVVTDTILPASMPARKSGCRGVTLSTRALVIGGYRMLDSGDIQTLAQVDSYDWVRDEWTLDVPPMKVARYDCAAVALPGDRALVAGGTDAGQSWLVSVEVYDDHIGGWAALPPLSIERDRCAAVALSAGDDGGTAATVLVMGGSARPTESAAAEAARVAEKRSGSPPAPPIVDLSSCETLSLDVHTAGSWLPAPELNFARCSFGAVALGGSVLVMGGGEGSATAERLDQDHRGWTTVASMPLPRSNTAAGHTAMVG